MSKVSIIIPVYNSENTLVRCLDSIHSQTFNDFEVLMINDGSTDNSESICRKYAERDIRFKLFNQKNSGPSVARNKGIDLAHSKYLYFVDSDDWIEANTLETFYKAAEENNAEVTVCGYDIYNIHGDFIKKHCPKLTPGLYVDDECKDIAINSLQNNYAGLQGFSWIRFVNSDWLKNSGFRYDTTIHRSEDFLLWTQLSFKTNRLFLLTDKCLYHYVITDGSTSRKYIQNYWAMLKNIYNILLETIPNEAEIVKTLNLTFTLRAFTSLGVVAHADEKKIFLKDLNEIVKDPLLKKLLKTIKIKDVKKRYRKFLVLLKFRLYPLIRLIYLKKFKENNI